MAFRISIIYKNKMIKIKLFSKIKNNLAIFYKKIKYQKIVIIITQTLTKNKKSMKDFILIILYQVLNNINKILIKMLPTI
jgi:hypothetical protein